MKKEKDGTSLGIHRELSEVDDVKIHCHETVFIMIS